MSVRVLDLLTEEEIADILATNAPLLDQQSAASGAKLRFSMSVSDAVRSKLTDAFGFSVANPVPAQIVRGDTVRHVDVGHEAFTNTHLVYLTDSEGALEIGGSEYSIDAGRAYVFSQGLEHGTVGATGARLSLGPFNELERYVGLGNLYYIYIAGYTPGAYTSSEAICNDDPNFTILDYSTLPDAVIPAGYVFSGWSTSFPPTTVDYTVGAAGACGDIIFNLYPVFTLISSPCVPVSQPYKLDSDTNTELLKSKVLVSTAPNRQQTYASSRTERLKAYILASKCCGNCS